MDRVIETQQGFECIVEGRRFGTWRSRAEAKAGMRVEQERAATKAAAKAKAIADKIEAFRSNH